MHQYNNANLWISSRTLMQWFRDFRYNQEKFPNIPKKRSMLVRLPPFFDLNPNLKDKFLQYAKENISILSPNLMMQYVTDELIPLLVEQEKKELDDEEITKEEVMKSYRLKTICIRTICNWMDKLGFKFSVRKKTYYVDGHERPDNVQYRKEYLQRYFSYEFRCFRWIRLPVVEVEELEKKDEIFNRKDGFKFEKEDLTFYSPVSEKETRRKANHHDWPRQINF